MAEQPATCPHCCLPLDGPPVVRSGRFSVDPDAVVLYDDAALPLTSGEHLIVSALIRARGAIVSQLTLGSMIGNAANPLNTVRVLIHRVRSKLAGIGLPCPIETVPTRGLRWAGAPALSMARAA